jgi:hypothetical protein
VLESFEIVPYYYGPWSPADITDEQNHLTGIAQYISGVNAPVLLVLPSGVHITGLGTSCSYHWSEDVNSYYAAITKDCSWPRISSHEVFEAAADPAIGNSKGWGETVDPCPNTIHLWFGDIKAAWDNSSPACSVTGYGPLTNWKKVDRNFCVASGETMRLCIASGETTRGVPGSRRSG